mgnify:FL=1
MEEELKEDDYVQWEDGEMITLGHVVRVMDNDEVLVKTGNGARNMEYVKKKNLSKVK